MVFTNLYEVDSDILYYREKRKRIIKGVSGKNVETYTRLRSQKTF